VLTEKELTQRLCERATQRYRAAGQFAWRFARGKLRGDPVFAALLTRGLVASDARLLDLGCGQGLFAAWLEAAGASHGAGEWCADWPSPPERWQYRGIEMAPAAVRRARVALGAMAQVEAGDLRHTAFSSADVAVIMDVLHYMEFADQEDVLRRVRAALSPAGLLLLRIGDAGGGLPFRVSNWVDRVVVLLRGQGWERLFCRPLQQWLDLLAELGFNTTAIPMSAETPFANVLLVARLQ
jgi:SAM-dependent methyltransferase